MTNLIAAEKALDQLPVGQPALISEIRADRLLARRLLGLGIRVGSRVRVTQLRGKGIVIACDGNRVALGESIARSLLTRTPPEIDTPQ